MKEQTGSNAKRDKGLEPERKRARRDSSTVLDRISGSNQRWSWRRARRDSNSKGFGPEVCAWLASGWRRPIAVLVSGLAPIFSQVNFHLKVFRIGSRFRGLVAGANPWVYAPLPPGVGRGPLARSRAACPSRHTNRPLPPPSGIRAPGADSDGDDAFILLNTENA